MKKIYLFTFLILIAFCSCDKKAKTAIETIQVRNLVENTHVETLVASQVLKENATTFFLVRHAEKAKDSRDPNLTEAGMKRATDLAQLLKSIPLDGIYSTNFNRTIQTATPVANAKGKEIQIYNHRDLEAAADKMLTDFPKGNILISGHSNTTPSMVNVLTGTQDYQSLSELTYDHLFIVSVYEKGNADVLVLKYGELTP